MAAIGSLRKLSKGLKALGKERKIKDLKPRKSIVGPAEGKVVKGRLKSKTSIHSPATLTSTGMNKQLGVDTSNHLKRVLSARAKDTGVKRTTAQIAPPHQIVKPTPKIDSVGTSRRADTFVEGQDFKAVTGKARTVGKKFDSQQASRQGGANSTDRLVSRVSKSKQTLVPTLKQKVKAPGAKSLPINQSLRKLVKRTSRRGNR